MLTLCTTVVASAIAAPATNTSPPIITSVQLDLPSAGQLTINRTSFDTARPTVSEDIERDD